MDTPIQYVEDNSREDCNVDAQIAKNLCSIINILEKAHIHTIDELKNVRDLSHVVMSMCEYASDTINLYAENNKMQNILLQAGMTPVSIYAARNKLFPTLPNYLVKNILEDIIDVLNFLVDYKEKIMDEFKITSFVSMYKIRSTANVTNHINDYLNSIYRFKTDIRVSFCVKDNSNDQLYEIIRNLNEKTYMKYKIKNQLIKFINENLLFEINFFYGKYGLSIEKIKNF
uniref:27 kDa protein n=1 Tax=Yam virus 1 TaxID=3123105 RepID=A0AAU6NE48_9CLOS